MNTIFIVPLLGKPIDMAKTIIEVQEDEIADFIEIYRKRLAKARQDKQDAENREKSALAKLKELGAPISAIDEPLRGLQTMFKDMATNVNNAILSRSYSLNDTIIGKIRYVLNESGRAMSTSEINNRLFELDPGYRADKKKTAKNVSSVLSVNHGQGKAFKRTVNLNNEYCFTINK